MTAIDRMHAELVREKLRLAYMDARATLIAAGIEEDLVDLACYAALDDLLVQLKGGEHNVS